MKFFRTTGRRRLLILLFCLWGACIIARASVFSVIDREKYRTESRRASWRRGVIPAIRGRILDASGVPLAWTEMTNSLTLNKIPADPKKKDALSAYLMKNFFFDLSSADALPKDVLRPVPPNLLKEAEEAGEKFSELTFTSVMERRRVEYSSIRQMIGECVRGEDGFLLGDGGLEKEYDVLLRGRNGKFSVMIDKQGKWIEGTLSVTEAPLHGEDVMLGKTVDELLKENWKRQ